MGSAAEHRAGQQPVAGRQRARRRDGGQHGRERLAERVRPGVLPAVPAGLDHPDHLHHLVLLTPALRAVGLTPTAQDWERHLESHRHQPWYADATAALDDFNTDFGSAEALCAASPLLYGHWDTEAETHAADTERSIPALRGYWADGAFQPGLTRRALMALTTPVLVYAAEHDPISPPYRCAELAELIPGATLVVQPGGGHYPWIDDPDHLRHEIETFLR